MKWAIIVAIRISVFGFIRGMGIPGAVALIIAEPTATTFLGFFGKTFNITTGDRAWPAAILMTWIWPASFVGAFYVAFRKLSAKKMWIRFAAFWECSGSGLLCARLECN